MNKEAECSYHIVVLLVDDQRMIGEILRRMLETERDIVFHYCDDPAKAIQTANEVSPSIILQDLVMPGVSGLSLVKSYRANPATKDVPIIVLSSEEDSKIKAEAFALNANDYLVKLPDKIELLARIRHHSEGYLNMLEKNMMEVRLRHSQKLESVGQLAAGIAHEINTPAQFIGDNLQFLKNSFSSISRILDHLEEIDNENPENSETLKDQINALKEEVRKADIDFLKTEINDAIDQSITGNAHIAKIVMAIKDFSSSSGAKTALNDINRLIENTVTVSKSQWLPMADMQLELHPGPLSIICCKEEINQVLLNLIINAAQAVGESGTRGIIKIKSELQNNFAVISISDTGIGIADEIKGRIFDPFFTTKDTGKGSGQGLTVAYDLIIRKHKGELTFSSEKGKGSLFTIKLPGIA